MSRPLGDGSGGGLLIKGAIGVSLVILGGLVINAPGGRDADESAVTADPDSSDVAETPRASTDFPTFREPTRTQGSTDLEEPILELEADPGQRRTNGRPGL